MSDIVKVCVTETYKAKVESIPIYDPNVISEVEMIVHTYKSYCLWVSERLAIKNQAVLNELSNILLDQPDKTYFLPRDWVDLSSHTDRFVQGKTTIVVDLLQREFPERKFVAEKSHHKFRKFIF